MKTAVILCAAVAALAAASAGLRSYWNGRFEAQVKALCENADYSSGLVQPASVESLPAPVRRYFRFALKDGYSAVRTARLVHGGRFKTKIDGEWSRIRGAEYFRCDRPGFVWRGHLCGASAVDSYADGKGSLSIYLLSMVKIMEGKGAEYDQGELLRWLGEAVWFPTALLPGKYISWKEAGKDRAELVLCADGLTVSYMVDFGRRGEIVRVETMRYKGSGSLERWFGVCGDYREVRGMMIPFRIEGGWILSGKEFPYADFTVERIDYDVTEILR